MSDAGLRFLSEAVKAGSIRAAADQMDMAASSVSRQIALLEQRHGITLIEKGRRGIRLTHAGEIVMEHYRHQIAEREALRAKLEDLRAVRTGVVNMAVGEGFLGRSFTDMIQGFQREYRDVLLNIKVSSSQDIARLVSDDEAHMGLVFQIPHDPKIQVRSAIAQPLMVIIPQGHVLAGRDRLSIPDLEGHALCLTEQSFRLRQIVNDAEALSGHHLKPTMITNSISVMLEMVRSGTALTILPAVSVWVELQQGSMIAIPLEEDRMNDTNISLILRSGRRLEGAPARFLGALDRLLRQWSQSLPRPRA